MALNFIDLLRRRPNYESMNGLATYYSPLFPQEERTPEFINIFAEMFGCKSFICQDLPRPLMCQDCIKIYIKNCEDIIRYLNENQVNLDVKEVFESKILPRFTDLLEQIQLLKEHIRASRERIDPDVMFQFFNINMDHYDPPSKNMIDKCQNLKYEKKEEEESCVVCMCDFEQDDEVKKLVCNHTFHNGCIMTWLNNHSTCPICKASLKEDVKEEEKVLKPYNFLAIIRPEPIVNNNQNINNQNDEDSDDDTTDSDDETDLDSSNETDDDFGENDINHRPEIQVEPENQNIEVENNEDDMDQDLEVIEQLLNDDELPAEKRTAIMRDIFL